VNSVPLAKRVRYTCSRKARQDLIQHQASTVFLPVDNSSALFQRHRTQLLQTSMKILTYSKWDAVAVLCGVLHFGYVVTFFFLFPHLPLWVSIGLGLIYSVSVSWNINGVSHNQIHNPFLNPES
jgi:hypothetical protein